MASTINGKLFRCIELWILSAVVLVWPSYVRCQTEGQVRLADGGQNGRGRVEIFHDFQWGTVCDDYWDTYDAQVVCRQLGFDSLDALAYTADIPGSGPIHLERVLCSGTESRLDECSHASWGVNDCTHSKDAAVECENNDGDLRLERSSTPNQGRVEIYHDGQWGKVCNNEWDEAEAKVVCRQLGYSSDDAMTKFDSAYVGDLEYWLDGFRCMGHEARLADCDHNGWGNHFCGDYQEAGVYCYDAGTEGDVRLVDGSTPSQGRVEIYHDGQWGTVCDDLWDDADARVVCRQLGYSDDSGRAWSGGTYGGGSGPIHLDNVVCTGYESRLDACSHVGWGNTNCGQYEDAGVQCSGDSPSPAKEHVSSRVVGTMSFVGVSLSLLTLGAIIAVWYTCSQSKTTISPRPSGQDIPLMTGNAQPAASNIPSATTNGNSAITYPSAPVSYQPPMPHQPAHPYPASTMPSDEPYSLPAPPTYNASQDAQSNPLPPPN